MRQLLCFGIAVMLLLVPVRTANLNERVVLGTNQSGGWFTLSGQDTSMLTRRFAPVGWEAYTSNWPEAAYHMAAGDVDGDGLDEVVVGFRLGGGFIAVYDDALNGHQLIKWLRINWQNYNECEGTVYPAVGDLDGDGKAEIVAGLGSLCSPYNGGGFMQIFDDATQGFASQGWLRLQWPAYNQSPGLVRPAIGDVDGDGRGEIIAGTDGQGFLEIFDDQNTGFAHMAWIQVQWAAYNSTARRTFPAVGDVDGDGKAEIIVGLAGRDTGYAGNGQGWIEVFDDAGNSFRHLRWLRIPPGVADGDTHPAVGDVDDDGRAEIVVAIDRWITRDEDDGWFAVFDDAAGDYTLNWRRLNMNFPGATTSYNNIWPTVGRFR